MNNIAKIAKFEKVSFEQFRKDWLKTFSDKYNNIYAEYVDEVEDEIRGIYNNIRLPRRSTVGSAGFDMFLPFNISIEKGESQVIPTGIRCAIDDGWMLALFPRSGHGFKYGIHLANTTGIIDSDFYYAENEGHIHVKLVNDSSLAKKIDLESDAAFCQGIFIPFGITIDDDANGIRTGGFGSTDKK